MKIKHTDLSIPQDNPFEHCQLAREPYAKVLTTIVQTYSDGFVLAINNEWGTGKTTFIKMWKQLLENKSYRTIYFNAWENDFDNNPLVALMAEFESISEPSKEKHFKGLLKNAATFTRNVLPDASKAIFDHFTGGAAKVTGDIVKNLAKSAADIFTEKVKEYGEKKKNIGIFRSQLETFVSGNDDKPLVFFIDELDRCRPTYAVEVLEQIKHLFAVRGIVFVLSIDKNHLASAVKGVYGSESINTDEYLRRFIDLEYSLPAPSNKAFCAYLFEYFSMESFFSFEPRMRHHEFHNDTKLLLLMAETLFDKSAATLRQQEKIFGHTRLILASFGELAYVYPHVFFLLVSWRHLKPDLFSKLNQRILSLQELSDAFAESMPTQLDSYLLNLVNVEALLLTMYNNYCDGFDKNRLYEKNEKGEPFTNIISKIETRGNQGKLAVALREIFENRGHNSANLSKLIKKINLTESFVLIES